MRKLIFLFPIFLLSIAAKAQWTDTGNQLTTDDEVIIKGLRIVNDISLGLERPWIYSKGGTERQLGLLLTNDAQTKAEVKLWEGNVHNPYISFSTSPDPGVNMIERMRINRYGNIGIGTNTPGALLDVEGNMELGTGTNPLKIRQGNFTFNGAERPYLFHDGGTNRKIGLGITDNGAIRNFIELYEGNNPGLQYIDFGIEGSSAMRINSEGRVAIGTLDFSGEHQLTIEGSIGSRKVVVQPTGWSDFVFEDHYDLPALEEVENHINENGHLPEIPSEEEVIKNGIDVGAMDAKLLQKIEELTLYMIDMNKQVQQLKSENKVLKEKIKHLEQ